MSEIDIQASGGAETTPAPDTSVDRALGHAEAVAERSGLIPQEAPDRAPEAAPAAETPAPRTDDYSRFYNQGQKDWSTADHWRARKEEGRRRAEERRAQQLLEERLATIAEQVERIGQPQQASEEPDFDLDQAAWIQRQNEKLLEKIEERLAPLNETLEQQRQRQAWEAEQQQNAAAFRSWAQERIEVVRHAESVFDSNPQLRREYDFHRNVLADSMFSQGVALFGGDESQAQRFMMSAMMSLVDLAERHNQNPALLIDRMGREQLQSSVVALQRLGFQITAPGAAAAQPQQAASRLRDSREAVASAEAGGAAPPAGERTTAKAPRDGDFLKFVGRTLSRNGGMAEVQKEGARRYGSDWPRVWRETQQTLRDAARPA